MAFPGQAGSKTQDTEPGPGPGHLHLLSQPSLPRGSPSQPSPCPPQAVGRWCVCRGSCLCRIAPSLPSSLLQGGGGGAVSVRVTLPWMSWEQTAWPLRGVLGRRQHFGRVGRSWQAGNCLNGDPDSVPRVGGKATSCPKLSQLEMSLTFLPKAAYTP